MNRNLKILVSGGGTGGHVFPALSIARELKQRQPGADILFVGAEDRMEMDKVPEAGFRIIGLPVAGFHRKKPWKNAGSAIKLMKSLHMASKILREFKPHVAVGVGGYASGPVIRKASNMGIPVLLQEQNSFAGLTNRVLARKAQTICVAYEGMEKYFPKEKIILTGNPVRQDILEPEEKKQSGLAHFDLRQGRPVILLLGGSLGAESLNHAMSDGYHALLNAGYQVIWQTGSRYYEEVMGKLDKPAATGMVVKDFISRMDMAYAAADLIISRAGAGTISELCLVGKPAVLVPSPNVAEDHQKKNALALVKKHAAVMLEDNAAGENLVKTCLNLLSKPGESETLGRNILEMAKPHATRHIVDEILKLTGREESFE